jgi:hypothetical protein
MSKILVDEIAPKTSGNKVLMPQGGIIQVQYTQFTGTNSVAVSNSSSTAFTDLTVNITPSSTSSIIKIEAMVNGEWSNQDGSTDSTWFFLRDSTKLAHPTAGNRNVGVLMGNPISYYSSQAGSTPEGAYFSYFDSPSSTSQITYKIAATTNPLSPALTYYLNRTVTDTDGGGYERGTSFICVTEIAG